MDKPEDKTVEVFTVPDGVTPKEEIKKLLPSDCKSFLFSYTLNPSFFHAL
jgi:hypothetical protein